MIASSPFLLLLAAAEQNPDDGSVLGYLLVAALVVLLFVAALGRRQQEPPTFEPFEESQALAPLTELSTDEPVAPQVTVQIDEVDIVLLRPPSDQP